MLPSDEKLTASMLRFVDYFAELGPRWGLASSTCRVHSLLYLLATPQTIGRIAELLDQSEAEIDVATKDLAEWGMATQQPQGWYASGEPWDLLFSALEQRRKREMNPALELLRSCRDEASRDQATPPPVRHRIARLLELVENLAAIDRQSRRLSPQSTARLISMGGSAARLMNRFFPT